VHEFADTNQGESEVAQPVAVDECLKARDELRKLYAEPIDELSSRETELRVEKTSKIMERVKGIDGCEIYDAGNRDFEISGREGATEVEEAEGNFED